MCTMQTSAMVFRLGNSSGRKSVPVGRRLSVTIGADAACQRRHEKAVSHSFALPVPRPRRTADARRKAGAGSNLEECFSRC